MIKTAFASSIGRVRETNQDFVKVFKNQNNIIMGIVCDGMGGHQGGDVASTMAVSHLGHNFEKTDFMDSSGIGVIMGRYKTICLIGGEVWAVHANARIKKILTLSGVTKIMQIYEEDES